MPALGNTNSQHASDLLVDCNPQGMVDCIQRGKVVGIGSPLSLVQIDGRKTRRRVIENPEYGIGDWLAGGRRQRERSTAFPEADTSHTA